MTGTRGATRTRSSPGINVPTGAGIRVATRTKVATEAELGAGRALGTGGGDEGTGNVLRVQGWDGHMQGACVAQGKT